MTKCTSLQSRKKDVPKLRMQPITGQQGHTHLQLFAIWAGVGMHREAEALLEAFPLIHHADADRELRGILLLRLLQALALGLSCIHQATVCEVQPLALHHILQSMHKVFGPLRFTVFPLLRCCRR